MYTSYMINSTLVKFMHSHHLNGFIDCGLTLWLLLILMIIKLLIISQLKKRYYIPGVGIDNVSISAKKERKLDKYGGRGLA